MNKILVLALFAVMPFTAQASSSTIDLFRVIANTQLTGSIARDVINWKVGDTENMDISADSLGKLGTSVETVEQDVGAAIWVKQTMALEGQNQVVETELNKADGKILDMKQNGQETAVPNETITVVSQDVENVTVPAGTFKTVHIVANTDQVKNLEIWANPSLTVMEGAIQEKMPTQYGITLLLQLTSFTHGSR